MVSDEAKEGYALFRQKVVSSGKLTISEEHEYTDRRAIYVEIALDTKRSDIVLTHEFLSDLRATPGYQAATDEYAAWLERRMQNFSPHEFHCKCGRPINVEIYWPSNRLGNRAASCWWVKFSDTRDSSLIAKCAVVMTDLARESFRGQPFRMVQAIVERVRRGADGNEIKFLSAASPS